MSLVAYDQRVAIYHSKYVAVVYIHTAKSLLLAEEASAPREPESLGS